MDTKAWWFLDKATWAPGPWQEEPDKTQWPDPATGLPCLIVRNRSGALCGYVGVSRSHPDYGKDYDDVPVDVHGGLTFADRCQPDREHGICHVVAPGEDEDVWWFGFDTAHAGDFSPASGGINLGSFDRFGLRFEGDTYKTLAYVQAETTALAKRLKERA